jgi:hypothetical protein
VFRRLDAAARSLLCQALGLDELLLSPVQFGQIMEPSTEVSRMARS